MGSENREDVEERSGLGVDSLRELRGVMAAHKVSRGQFATTSTITEDAQAFAQANQINLLDLIDTDRVRHARLPHESPLDSHSHSGNCIRSRAHHGLLQRLHAARAQSQTQGILQSLPKSLTPVLQGGVRHVR